MRPGLSAREVGLQIGRAVLEAEHRHFVAEMLDNEEHVPRILRIAGAVASGLEGCEPRQYDMAEVRTALESYGRDLFLSEWKARLMEEAEQEEDVHEPMQEAAVEYDRLRSEALRRARDV